MFSRTSLVFFFQFFAITLFAQNLVVNPSFENTVTNCSNIFGEGFFGDLPTYDNADVNFPNDSCSTPDLFSACNIAFTNMPGSTLGYQYSRTGTRHAGFIPYDGTSSTYREYIQGQTSAPLTAGQTYCVSMYVSLPNNVVFATNNIGVYLSPTHYQRNACINNLINVTPQLNATCTISDTVNWVRLQWDYVATGGERYFVIGNFFNNANTTVVNTGVISTNVFAYYYVDDISITANTCCHADILPVGPFCQTDGPVILSARSAACAAAVSGTWSGTGITNAATGTFNPSVAGVGTHTISYTLNCGYVATTTIRVNNCAPLTVCIESNGQYRVSGGAGPYTWETGAPFQNCAACPLGFCIPIICPGVLDTAWTAFATGATATPPGTFPIRVRDSGVNELMLTSAANLPNCTVCATLTVSVSSQTNVSCFGGNNGSATVNTTGGTAPYTYQWQPGNLTGPSQSTLTANTYTIIATDANSCTGTGTVTINQPSSLSLSTSKTDATCGSDNGAASVSASGGTAPYTYLWSNNETTPSIDSLPVGNYSVVVTDLNGCTATASVAITSIGGATITLSAQTNLLCNGDNNGAISVTVTGGNPPYTFLWSDSSATQNIFNLTAGPYSLTVTDSTGCVSLFNATITEPAALSVTGIVTDAGCGAATGAINLTVAGGVAPYVTRWSTGSAQEDLTGLQAGNYTVIVTDNNSCADTVSFTVNAPGNFSVTLTADSASCQGVSDGDITSTISGGSAPFLYSWSNGESTPNLDDVAPGVYTVIVTDDNICSVAATATVYAPSLMHFNASITRVLCEGGNEGGIKLNVFGGTPPYSALWSNGDSGLSLIDLAPDLYTATVIDANGCNRDTTISLEAASTYSIGTTVINASCDGAATGSVEVVITDGTTPPYAYVWSNGDSSASIINVAPGVYSVTVTDSLNCLRMDTATVIAGGGILVSSTAIDVTCPNSEDGSITTTVSGGTEPYTYQWNISASTSSLTNIGVGTYYVTVTDNDDCASTDTAVVGVDSLGLGDCDTLVIYDVFSPNGDGTNEIWIIDGLEGYPNNELQIFNRWGSVVFEAQPYLNDWKGISNKDEALPSATYYYILKLHDADEKVYSGSITLIR